MPAIAPSEIPEDESLAVRGALAAEAAPAVALPVPKEADPAVVVPVAVVDAGSVDVEAEDTKLVAASCLVLKGIGSAV